MRWRISVCYSVILVSLRLCTQRWSADVKSLLSLVESTSPSSCIHFRRPRSRQAYPMYKVTMQANNIVSIQVDITSWVECIEKERRRTLATNPIEVCKSAICAMMNTATTTNYLISITVVIIVDIWKDLRPLIRHGIRLRVSRLCRGPNSCVCSNHIEY